MRHHPWAVLAALSLTTCIPAFPGPFGLEKGMSKEQVITLVGKNAVEKEQLDALGGSDIILKTAPKTHPGFERYLLFFSKASGLLKIIAVGHDVQTASDGSELRDQFNEIKAQLTQTYGQATKDLDFIHEGSLWDKPEDFMMGLLEKERTVTSYWEPKDGALPFVSIELKATNQHAGYVEITYEYAGWGPYLEKVKAAQGSNL